MHKPYQKVKQLGIAERLDMNAVLVDKSAMIVALVLALVCVAALVVLFMMPRAASNADNQSTAGIFSLPFHLLLLDYVVFEIVILRLLKFALVPVLPILFKFKFSKSGV